MWATGVGSMPGADATAYAEAMRIVAGELGGADDLVFLPELPGRVRAPVSPDAPWPSPPTLPSTCNLRGGG